MGMKRCPECGAFNPDKLDVCFKCKVSLKDGSQAREETKQFDTLESRDGVTNKLNQEIGVKTQAFISEPNRNLVELENLVELGSKNMELESQIKILSQGIAKKLKSVDNVEMLGVLSIVALVGIPFYFYYADTIKVNYLIPLVILLVFVAIILVVMINSHEKKKGKEACEEVRTFCEKNGVEPDAIVDVFLDNLFLSMPEKDKYFFLKSKCLEAVCNSINLRTWQRVENKLEKWEEAKSRALALEELKGLGEQSIWHDCGQEMQINLVMLRDDIEKILCPACNGEIKVKILDLPNMGIGIDSNVLKTKRPHIFKLIAAMSESNFAGVYAQVCRESKKKRSANSPSLANGYSEAISAEEFDFSNLNGFKTYWENIMIHESLLSTLNPLTSWKAYLKNVKAFRVYSISFNNKETLNLALFKLSYHNAAGTISDDYFGCVKFLKNKTTWWFEDGLFHIKNLCGSNKIDYSKTKLL